MSRHKTPFAPWKNKSVTAKVGVGLFLILSFLAIVILTASVSMHFVREADESIRVSNEIQRLVLEMDRGMENARHLQSQFFIEYPKVGLTEAHEKFAQPAIRQAAHVVSLSKKLKGIISSAKVSEALRESKVDITLYLSSAKRFADTSIDAVRYVTLLATPETGLESRLDQQLNRLNSELNSNALSSELFHQMERLISKHRRNRKRFHMQSAFNVAFDMSKLIDANTTLTSQQKGSLHSLIDSIKELSEKILETDVLIKAKFADFALQKQTVTSISSTLVDLAGQEVIKSRKKIHQAYKTAQIALLVVSLIGLFVAVTVVFLLNQNITRRIIRLTRSAEELQKGSLDVTIEDDSRDELGRLAQTFTFMAARIRDLVGNLEAKIDQQTQDILLEKEKAQNYLDVAGVMLTVLDASGKITLLNQKGCELLKTTEQQAIGQDWFTHYLPENIRDEVWDVFQKLMAGDVEPVEYYENAIVTSTGEERIVAFHNTILKDSQGHISGVLFSGEDVTEHKQYEAERAGLEAQLRQAHKMEAIGTLAGGIAHDFNNILAAILGYTELAMEDNPQEDAVKYNLEEVMRAGIRAKELVQHILLFSRKESQERKPVKINNVLQEALKLLRATIPVSIKIEQHLDNSCGYILADATQIHQIVMNLSTNASHAMEEGGVLEVTTSCAEISPSELPDCSELKAGFYAKIVVKDTGTGIAPGIIDRIFDPYFTTKEFGKGSGMGLSVVMGIVKGHDGIITVQSELGQGTTFTMYFPCIGDEPEKQITPRQLNPTGNESILVVDDDESIAELTKRRLEILGYQVTAMTRSTEALQLFRDNPRDYDLVITDQTMPDLTGEKLAPQLLSIRKDLPIIMCTGFSSRIDADKAHSLGIKAFVMKPIENEELARTVRKVLDEHPVRKSDEQGETSEV